MEITDDVKFELVDISDIREGDDYPGIRVALKANYPPISVPLTVDVTTGDVITPREIEYTFSLLFDDRTISILANNLETVLPVVSFHPKYCHRSSAPFAHSALPRCMTVSLPGWYGHSSNTQN